MEIEKVVQHTSFGMVSISRVNGGDGRFFGTDMQPNVFIQVDVSQNAVMEYDEIMGCKARASGKRRDEVVSFRMTSTQFAELITTLNIGDGVPCTIERVCGNKVPQYEEEIQSTVNYEAEKLERALKSYRSEFARASKQIEELTTSLPKTKKTEIINIINRLSMHVCANTPFHLHCFEEAVEKTVANAKSEIANYLSVGSNIVRLEAMQGRNSIPREIDLPESITDITPRITDK